MFHLIDFCNNGEPLRNKTIMGEPPAVAVFPTKQEARTFAEARGYKMHLEDRFLLNVPRKGEPIYIKIKEIK